MFICFDLNISYLPAYEQFQFSMHGTHCVVKICVFLIFSYYLSLNRIGKNEQQIIAGSYTTPEWHWYVRAEKTCCSLEQHAQIQLWRMQNEKAVPNLMRTLYRCVFKSTFLKGLCLVFKFFWGSAEHILQFQTLYFQKNIYSAKTVEWNLRKHRNRYFL